ncbi:permeability factor 2-like isoform X2 [Stigmatopora argus]
MMSKAILSALLVLLVSVAMSEGSLGVEMHCRCIETERRMIRKLLANITLIPPNAHCQQTEIIATLKKGRVVCLDPTAPWVKEEIENYLNNKQRR